MKKLLATAAIVAASLSIIGQASASPPDGSSLSCTLGRLGRSLGAIVTNSPRTAEEQARDTAQDQNCNTSDIPPPSHPPLGPIGTATVPSRSAETNREHGCQWLSSVLPAAAKPDNCRELIAMMDKYSRSHEDFVDAKDFKICFTNYSQMGKRPVDKTFVYIGCRMVADGVNEEVAVKETERLHFPPLYDGAFPTLPAEPASRCTRDPATNVYTCK